MTNVVASIAALDGYPLQYRVWPPGGPRALRGDLVLLNGVMSHSEWFEAIASPLARNGFKVIGADRRGSGSNLADRGDAPSALALVDDVLRIVESERTQGRPLYLVGWCWGAVLALNVAVRAKGLSGLGLLAPGLFLTERIQQRMSAQQKVAADRSERDQCLENPISEEMFTQGPCLQSFILRDDLRLRSFTPRFHGIMVRMGLNALRCIPQLVLPTLLVLADRDEATDNERTLRAFQNVGKDRLTVVGCRASHGIQFDAPDELLTSLLAWINAAERRN
jgi:alpha-beta hydrolase superfamily lysophospholipase